MAKKFNKYFSNNLKESVYLSNIERVDFDETKTDNNNVLSESKLERRRKEMDDIQIRTRHNNMRIYLKNILDYRLTQVFTLAIPAALTIGTVASFVAPYQRTASKDFSTAVVKESTVLSNTDGQITDNSEHYYYSNTSLTDSFKFVSENDFNYTRSACSNSLTYQISDGIESALAKFSYDSEGKLSFDSLDVGNFIDVSEYDFSESSSIDEKYERLFDDVMSIMLSNSNLTEEQRQALENLSNSENKKIIIDIVKFENLDDSVTEIYKNRFWQRFFLLVFSIVYAILFYAITKEEPLSRGNKLYAKDGELCYSTNELIGFWHVSLKYKEAFIKAETERIEKAQKLANEYFNMEDASSLFTSFEKNLTLVDKKER